MGVGGVGMENLTPGVLTFQPRRHLRLAASSLDLMPPLQEHQEVA